MHSSSAGSANSAYHAAPPAQNAGQSTNDTRSRNSAGGGRGGNDDLNVDRILKDYENAPAGQPMPDGVILYSQGYFPPDPKSAQKPSDEAFGDDYSDEDEQRINDLLDVFASDVTTSSDQSMSTSGVMPAAVERSQRESGNTPAYGGANFAQSSYSASLAAAAADGWGVPDLMAAGANLSGAEMFARAQAELANSGWAYSQSSASQAGAGRPDNAPGSALSDSAVAPSAYSAPRQPAPPPGPLGQPTFVTPAPPPVSPARFGQSELVSSNTSDSLGARASAPSSPAISTPVPASASGSESGSHDSSNATQSFDPTSSSDDHNVDLKADRNQDREQGQNEEHKQDQKHDHEAEPSNVATDEADKENPDSLFSPQLKHSISDALSGNPFKIRNSVGGESGSNIDAVSSEAAKESTAEIAAGDSKQNPEPTDNNGEKDVQSRSADDSKAGDARSDSDKAPEAKVSEASTPEPSQVRGKFGTKTGLAAKRKALEVAEDSDERNDVVYLLKTANFFTADQLEDALVDCLRDQNKAVEILAILGIMDKSNLDAAVRLQKLVKAGSVEKDKAIESLKSLQSGKIRPSELTEQLGIKKPKRRK